MIFILPYWVTKAIRDNNVILFNWKTNNSVKIHDVYHPIYDFKIENNIFIEDIVNNKYRDDINWLISSDFIVDEKKYIKSRFNLDSLFNKKILNLILLPAGEACNLDCIYCYEDHDDKKSMKKHHAYTLLEMIKKSKKDHVHIEYFGGEPMLNMNFISFFSDLLKKENISHSGAITTNGTLLNEDNLDILYSSNIKSFQITLDGPEDIHNSLRVSKSKNINSFSSVYNSLKVLSKSSYLDINVILRMNVNEKTIEDFNFDRFTQTIESVIPKDDNRFLLLPKIISDYSNLNLKEKNSAEEAYCKKSERNKVISKFEEYIDENYFSANAQIISKKGGYTCYAANENSLVITPDLYVRKCTVAIDDPINIVGRISDNGDFIKNNNFSQWIKDYSDQYCNSCFAQKTCQGNSCPLENIRQNQKICPPLKVDINSLTNQVVKFYEKKITNSKIK